MTASACGYRERGSRARSLATTARAPGLARSGGDGSSDPGDVPHHHGFGAASYGGEVLRAVLEREGCSSCLVPEGDGPRQMWMRQRRRSTVFRREPLRRAELERDLLPGEEIDGEMDGRLRAGPPQPEHLVAMPDRSLLRFR